MQSTARQGPAAGWSVTVHEVQEDGTERLRLKASGAVPATSTHGTAAPPQAPTRHTDPSGGTPGGGGSRAGVHEAGEERHRAQSDHHSEQQHDAQEPYRTRRAGGPADGAG